MLCNLGSDIAEVNKWLGQTFVLFDQDFTDEETTLFWIRRCGGGGKLFCVHKDLPASMLKQLRLVNEEN